jgi:GH24 family phage-related lysozyme (muramidase)
MRWGCMSSIMYRGINMGDGWETARKLTRPAILEAGEGGLIKVRQRRQSKASVLLVCFCVSD